MDDVEAGTSPSPAKDPGSAADAEHQPELDGDGAETAPTPGRAQAPPRLTWRATAPQGARRRPPARDERRRRHAPGMAPAPPADQPELPESPREGRLTPEVAERTLVRKPQIGDTRPAPGGASSRRRRRSPKSTTPKHVAPQAVVARHAAAGPPSARTVGGASVTPADRRGRERNGRPIGRYMMCVQVRDGHGPGRRARGPQPHRALRVSAGRRRQPDPRQHLRRSGAERAARHGGGVRRHRHPEERRALPRRRAVRRRGHRAGRTRGSSRSCGPAS